MRTMQVTVHVPDGDWKDQRVAFALAFGAVAGQLNTEQPVESGRAGGIEGIHDWRFTIAETSDVFPPAR